MANLIPKASMNVNYDSRAVITCKLFILTTLDSYIVIVDAL